MQATHSFFRWFVTEQVEAESSDDDVVERLKLPGDPTSRLFMLDKELLVEQKLFVMFFREHRENISSLCSGF